MIHCMKKTFPHHYIHIYTVGMGLKEQKHGGDELIPSFSRTPFSSSARINGRLDAADRLGLSLARRLLYSNKSGTTRGGGLALHS